MINCKKRIQKDVQMISHARKYSETSTPLDTSSCDQVAPAIQRLRAWPAGPWPKAVDFVGLIKTHLKKNSKSTLSWSITARTLRVQWVPSHQLVLSSCPDDCASQSLARCSVVDIIPFCQDFGTVMVFPVRITETKTGNNLSPRWCPLRNREQKQKQLMGLAAGGQNFEASATKKKLRCRSASESVFAGIFDQIFKGFIDSENVFSDVEVLEIC